MSGLAAAPPARRSNPVFIIGAPRSGTTALAWSLAKHPSFCNLGESQVLLDLFGDGELERNYIRLATPGGSFLAQHGIERERFLSFVGSGFDALFTTCSGGLRWIDKTPANALIADTVAGLFPDALFLHMLRDGRQVVHSMLNFASLDTRAHLESVGEPWMHDFRSACRTWREYVAAALLFQQAHPARCITVVHSELAADPHRGFGQIFAFLGTAAHHGSAEHFRTHLLNSSFADDGSDPATRRLAPAREPWTLWTDEERAVFREEAGETLVSTGLVHALSELAVVP
jgi:hypothetical protein